MILLNRLALLFVVAASSAFGGELEVVDSNGRIVGREVPAVGAVGALRTISGTRTAIIFWRSSTYPSLLDYFHGQVQFATTDCSGPPWFDNPAAGVWPSLVQVETSGAFLYLADSMMNDPVGGQAQSMTIDGGPCVPDDNEILPNQVFKASAPPVKLKFVPPFSVK